MTQTELSNGWLYSHIYDDDEYICDTLELLHDATLKSGVYSLRIANDKKNNDKIIEVVDELGVCSCCFVRENTEYHYGLKIRSNNNNITVGTKINMPLLVTGNYVYRWLLTIISNALRVDGVVSLVFAGVVEPQNGQPLNGRPLRA